MQASTFGSVRSTGFSQKIALPAFAAAIERSAWLPVDEAMSTACTAGSPNACASVACRAPERLGKRARRFGLRVDDVEQLRVAAAHEVLGVHLADTACAEERKGDHGIGSAFPDFSDLIAASASTRARRPSSALTGMALLFFKAETKLESSMR